MESIIQINSRPVRIILSSSAERAIMARTTPLLAEMELYFSCLIRQKVRFYEKVDDTNTVKVNDLLLVRFRPVMTLSCGKNYEGDEPPLTDFPIQNESPFVPRWLRIDFRKNKWQGDFGFSQE